DTYTISGLILHNSAYPKPQDCRTRELKFSMTMSEMAISRFAISKPMALRTLRQRLFLLTFVSLKLPEVFKLTSRPWGVVVLGSLPRSFSGHSILMTSAPKAPSQRVAHGPARTQLKSTTRTPSRAPRRAMCALLRCQAIGHHRLMGAQLLQHICTAASLLSAGRRQTTARSTPRICAASTRPAGEEREWLPKTMRSLSRARPAASVWR